MQHKYKNFYLHSELLAVLGFTLGVLGFKLCLGMIYMEGIFNSFASFLLSFFHSTLISLVVFIALLVRPTFALYKYTQQSKEDMLFPILNRACYKLGFINLLLIFKASFVLGFFSASHVDFLPSISSYFYLFIVVILSVKLALFFYKATK